MARTATFAVDWDRIDTVLVDMDGTLLDLAFDNFFWLDVIPQSYGALHGLGIDEARQRLAPRFAAVAGTLPWYCLDHWTRDLGLDIKALKRAHRHLIRYLPGAPAFLESVRGRGKSLKIVTNAHRDTFAVKAEQTGIDKLVDDVVCSHDLGSPKESAAFWHALERHEPFDRTRTLFLEDSLPVLNAARAHGIAHTIAIRKPDSSRPPRVIDDYVAIDGVVELV
jgi:putative hydrolase of the HAD superfamily